MIKVRISWANDQPSETHEKEALAAILAFTDMSSVDEEDGSPCPPYNVEVPDRGDDYEFCWHSGKKLEIEVESLEDVIRQSICPVIFHKPLDGIHYATIWNGYIE